MNKIVVFVDSSFFKSLIDVKDEWNKKANRIWQRFENEKVKLATSNYIIDESLTLIRSKCNLETAIKFRDLVMENTQVLKVVRVMVQDEASAWKWFVKNWSKLSYTDCVSFAVMKRLGIKRAASFDEHFKRAGFKVEK